MRGAWAALAAAALAVVVAFVGRDGDPAPPAAAAGRGQPLQAAPAPAPVQATPLPPAVRPAAPPTPRERAVEALAAYRQATRYPPSSQPLAAHADQADPNAPVREDLPFGDGGLTLVTSQQRIYLVGDESVRFGIALRDAAGRPAPLAVLRASARELPPPDTASLYPEVPVDFADDAGSGELAAVLQPAAQGFAGLHGAIRVEAQLRSGQHDGAVAFDVVLTPESPALWSGRVRETLADGALHFDLDADVRTGGRYVVTARVDDALGRPLALLTHNEELAAGAQTLRLTLFGKLVRDAQPAFPLTLRDVEGWLLHDDSYPDRSLMPRRAGTLITSGIHPLDAFSDAEWNSEQRSRTLDALARDVERAR